MLARKICVRAVTIILIVLGFALSVGMSKCLIIVFAFFFSVSISLLYTDAFDLAEWGVVVDDANQTRKMLVELWDPMWENSFTGQDCDLEEVLSTLVADSEMSSVGVAVDAFLESVNNTNVTALFNELLSGQGTTHATSNDTFTVSDTEAPTPAPTHNTSTGDMTTSPTSSPTDASGASRMFEYAPLFYLLGMAASAFLHL